MKTGIRIGIDIGGTFTDFVIFRPDTEALETFKLLSTPDNPAIAVINGLGQILEHIPIETEQLIHIIHGSTVATNALLERKGARTALITTLGFRDILQIGRQNRNELYNLFTNAVPPLIPRELRLEVPERVGKRGEIIKSLDPGIPQEILSAVNALQPESIAICLLFSFTNPQHEDRIATILREAGYIVSVSSEILPEYREYERMSTTVVNAYVSPVLQRYLDTLVNALKPAADSPKRNISIRVMQSNGGIIRLDEARKNGVRCILSGPAGGVIGARQISYLAGQNNPQARMDEIKLETGREKIITFDMGGTSTDVSLIDGEPQVTTEATVGGYPIRIPVLDIHTIGAGGGSIAAIDSGGVLRVGPESAGANPGPACYGKGTIPTVTDANLVLGRLQEEFFLGGRMPIFLRRAKEALGYLGAQLNLGTSNFIEATALGIIEIINAHMERALRVISVERGYDPQDFTLLSFGGAGGLHAVDLARRVKIPRVLIPPLASTLSAYGMLNADIVRDYTHTIMLTSQASEEEITAAFDPLIHRAFHDFQEEDIPPDTIVIEKKLDMRYQGQSYEITLPLTKDYIADFHTAHFRTYGTSREQAEVEIVNARVRATCKVFSPHLPFTPAGSADPSPAYLETRKIWFENGPENVPMYRGESLSPGNRISGPAVVIRSDTTILVGIHDQAWIDEYYNLHIDVAE